MTAALSGADKIHILLVEDSRSEGFITQRHLQRLDEELEVMRAMSLAEALDILEHSPIDAILLDLGLPDSDGPNSIRTLNEEFPHIPIVVLSGREDEVAVLRSLEYGAYAFLLKGKCTEQSIRHAIFNAIFRNSLKGKDRNDYPPP